MATNAPFGAYAKFNVDGTALLGPDGTEYDTIRSPVRVVYSSYAPWALAQSGTVGSNGALTLNTAMPCAFQSGLWLYFPANAVYSGSPAGWYWAELPTTTTGTVYANYSANSTGTVYPPATLTPLSGTTGSAYTGWTGSSSTFLNVVTAEFGFPLEPGDSITVDYAVEHTNTNSSTNGKWNRVFGTNVNSYIIARDAYGTDPGYCVTKSFYITRKGYTIRASGWSSTEPNMRDLGYDAINIADPSLTFAISRQVATDYHVLQYFRIVHYARTNV